MAQIQFWWVSDSVSHDWLTWVTRLSVLGDQTDKAFSCIEYKTDGKLLNRRNGQSPVLVCQSSFGNWRSSVQEMLAHLKTWFLKKPSRPLDFRRPSPPRRLPYSTDSYFHILILILYFITNIKVTNKKEIQQENLLGPRPTHSCLVEKFKFSKINGKMILTLLRPLERPNKKVKENRLAFFWPNWSSESVRGPNTQIQIHKYTNTQIQFGQICR